VQNYFTETYLSHDTLGDFSADHSLWIPRYLFTYLYADEAMHNIEVTDENYRSTLSNFITEVNTNFASLITPADFLMDQYTNDSEKIGSAARPLGWSQAMGVLSALADSGKRVPLIAGQTRCKGETVFFDDFSGGLGNWTLVVFNSAGGSETNPLPSVEFSMGNPAPSFDSKGDSWCGNGAFSTQTFDYTNGLTILADLYINDTRTNGGCWVAASFGIADELPAGVPIDNAHCDTTFAAGISLDSNGPACWGSPEPRDAFITYYLKAEDGTTEQFTEEHVNAMTRIWKTFKIEILPDRHVKFYRDNTLVYSSAKKLSTAYIGKPLSIGTRSSVFGPALVDNIAVCR